MGAVSGSSARVDLGRVWQRSVFDAHRLRAARRRFARNTKDERNRIAQHPHRATDRREEMLVERIIAQAIFARDIQGGQHAQDSRDFESGEMSRPVTRA